jgi:YidC/Oxa1 family membrane protein insertase
MFDGISALLRVSIFATSHVLGGSIGAAILAVCFALRLLLLPLTLRLARRRRAQQAILTSLRPELERLNVRFKDDPMELLRRTHALQRRAGYKPFDGQTLLGSLVQVPVLGAMYGALRRGLGGAVGFLWVPNLLRPDPLLALLVMGLTALGTWFGVRADGGPPRSALLPVAITATLTLVFFWRASAALLLSWGANAAGNLLQGTILLRENRSRPSKTRP